METQPAEIDRNAVSIGDLNTFKGSTSGVDKSNNYVHLRIKRTEYHTDTIIPLEGESGLNESNPTSEINTHYEPTQSVNGSILEIRENSAYCEIHGKESNGYVLLPIDILPSNYHYGMPITIRLDNQGGIKRFIVEKRKINLGLESRELGEFDNLIAEL